MLGLDSDLRNGGTGAEGSGLSERHFDDGFYGWKNGINGKGKRGKWRRMNLRQHRGLGDNLFTDAVGGKPFLPTWPRQAGRNNCLDT